MEYLLTISCMVLAGCICVVSYMVIDKRLQVSQEKSCESDIVEMPDAVTDSDINSESVTEEEKHMQNSVCFFSTIKQTFLNFTISRWVVFVLAVLLIGAISYYAQVVTWNGEGLDTIGIAKVIIISQVMMSAAVIDFYTKKIPNTLPLSLLGVGLIFLLIEFFYVRDSFFLLLASSLVGLIGVFLIMLLMSLLTRGGIGMGDVKLISAMGFVSGIAAVFNTFLYANIICLIVTLLLLITKKKKMKDELPFGPFLFIGYILVVIIGKF